MGTSRVITRILYISAILSLFTTFLNKTIISKIVMNYSKTYITQAMATSQRGTAYVNQTSTEV